MELPDLVERRSNFLREAAHLLAVSSPTASAFLGAAQDRLIEDAEIDLQPKEVDALRRAFCGACGNPMIAGWSCKVAHQTEKRARNEKKLKSTQPAKHLVYTCLRCERQTVQSLQTRPPRHVRKSTARKAAQPLPESKPKEQTDAKAVKSVNASSKERKKARKGGLAAMLEKSKAQNANQGGFDLMDFGM
ncbi:hypothetical protein OPT61_g9705 [Boeremia exigua]|uniref:Uncharacterized protein n=1 Tax=Boeremia exigua TaxID=749465 RepID=A0ACC2HTZ2_9PLEO|nr:hypothetical protein OPT61_g9705 [Boeremia exigua]